MQATIIRRLRLTCCFLFSVLTAAGQDLQLSPQAEISLITVSPGAELYSMYGHSAIRVLDEPAGVDYVFNYGTFDFNTPNFYVKFVRGKLLYHLSISYYEDLKNHSIRDNRSVVEQVLHLSPQEKQKVVDLLAVNYQPENRSYLYDFFFDNCATRIRDIFQKGLGRNLQFSSAPAPDPMTFRQLVGIYQQPHPWVDLGVDLVMGLPADAQASPWQTMFLPDYLLLQFNRARVGQGAAGAQTQPFVKETRQIFQAQPSTATASLQRPSVVFWTLLVLAAAFTFYQLKNRQTQHTLDLVLFGLAGLLGVVVLYLWFDSDHKAFADNLNFLWAFPLHLPFAFLLWRKSKPALVRKYFFFTAILSSLIAACWPVFPQEFHQAVFPLLLLLALRAWYVVYASRKRAVTGYR
jgi:hypothetical protein